MSAMAEFHADIMEQRAYCDPDAEEVAYVHACMTGLQSHLPPALYAQIETALGFHPQPAPARIEYHGEPLPF